jgi:glycosyltransferase involved in cell wall biosynthesis
MRGGEKVLDAICELFPEAELWTLFYIPGSTNARIEGRPIHPSPLQHFPALPRNYRNYLPFYPLMAELNRANNCELVISSSHAVAKAMVRRSANGRPLHICYIHTPMRYAWDRFDDYFGAHKVGRLVSLLFFRPLAAFLQAYDRATSSRVDVFCANSSYVANRVRRVYGREAIVVHPPVEVERFAALQRAAEDWYLVVSALVPYKRVDHAIEACARLKRKLRIVGSGPEEAKLRALARRLEADVEFFGYVSDAELGEFYRHARALLFPGVEDFGIVPVEAIASGCPVIALGEGGVLDAMTARTAVFFSDPTISGLQSAINDFEKMQFDEAELRTRAQQFSKRKFLEKFGQVVQEFVAASNQSSTAVVQVQ